ncbi:Zinc finger MYM-type protein [Hibiscus syriacus]|uniref:Zinc finger MYM-type protein n=2 Tax=Hibiscus syriacus TaxID=106335 RepID=A0A6A2X4C2_HIBSY|nr:Zinc finger MYM-type protein [Hibiscus syriacus]
MVCILGVSRFTRRKRKTKQFKGVAKKGAVVTWLNHAMKSQIYNNTRVARVLGLRRKGSLACAEAITYTVTWLNTGRGSVFRSVVAYKSSAPHIFKAREFCLKFGEFTEGMEQIVEILHGLKAAMLKVVVQIVFAGVNVLYKLAVCDGMSMKVTVAYRFIFASALMNPLALLVERNSPKLTRTILVQAFFCGLLGCSVAQNLYIEAMALTSATFVSATTNLIPAITFIVAVTVGLEKAGFGTRAGKAKVLGTLIGLGGAMIFTFFKGLRIGMGSIHLDLLHHLHHVASSSSNSHPGSAHHVLGALLALGSCISYAIWLNIQTKMSEKYPCYYSSTALTCTMAAIQTTALALCVEKDWSQWKLGWNIRLLTVAYAGIFGSGLMISLISWCVRMRGPLYASSFSPLLLVLVALAGAFFLEEKFHLGSIIGAVLIVVGLYVVLWGKGQEMKRMNQSVSSNKICSNNGAIQVVVAPCDDTTSNISNNDNNSTR